MKIPRSRSHDVMQTIVRRRAELKEVVRPSTDSSGRFGEHDSTTTTISDVSMWLFNPTEINVDTQFGDRVGGDLEGLALPDADVQVNDRVDHGTDTYEVQRIYHIPDDDRKALKRFSLQRRVNDDSEP
jgi:hypothetical protein